MKKRTLITLATSLLFTTAAWAQPPGNAERGAGPGGHGMMRGYGPGPGMMGGYGMGPGMMGGFGAGNCGMNVTDLTKEQQSKIADIQKEFRQKQWALMQAMHEHMQQGGVYRNGKFDEQAARKAYDSAANIHKQMFENSIDAHKRIDSVLTAQQREQLQRAWGGR